MAWQPDAIVYVSGPDHFVDHAAALLRGRGYADGQIKIQRFGL